MKRIMVIFIVIVLLMATGIIIASEVSIQKADRYIEYLDKKYGW